MMNESTNERKIETINGMPSKKLKLKTNERIIQRANEITNKITNVITNKRTNERTNKTKPKSS